LATGYKQRFVHGRIQFFNIGNGRGPIQRDQELLNHSRIELQTVYRDTLFSYEEGRF
jgi:hypothetical protein